MDLILIGAGVIVAAVLLLGVLLAWLGGRQVARQDKAWAPSGYRYTHEGYDPELRRRTQEKRAQESRLKRVASRVASTPTGGEPRLKVVNGGGRIQ